MQIDLVQSSFLTGSSKLVLPHRTALSRGRTDTGNADGDTVMAVMYLHHPADLIAFSRFPLQVMAHQDEGGNL